MCEYWILIASNNEIINHNIFSDEFTHYFIFSFSIINSSFINNHAFAFSNAVDVTCFSLAILQSNFTGNTPTSAISNWRGQGGALFLKIREIFVNNTCFISNKNYAGGALYIEQHGKYSQFIARLYNILALSYWADADGSFAFFSDGLFSVDFLVESTFFFNNRDFGGKISWKKNIYRILKIKVDYWQWLFRIIQWNLKLKIAHLP